MVEAIISMEALQSNVQVLKKLCLEDSQIIWVIKANAYGHGAIKIAKLFEKDEIFAVARLKEALELRNAGILNRILLLEGVFNQKELKMASEINVDLVIHSKFQLSDLISAELGNVVNIWLKVDTGMNRLGVMPSEVEFFLDRLTEAKNVCNEIGFISHFATADTVNCHRYQGQIDTYNNLLNSFKNHFNLVPSIANSSAFFNSDEHHLKYSRIGLALYGISPFKNISSNELGLKPVMKLETILISIKKIRKEEFAGYGLHWSSRTKTIIGIVAIGYGDGYPRNTMKGTYVYINGRKVNVIGVACMDMILVDLGNDSLDKEGDKVTLWGPELPVEDVAKTMGTIPYELISHLTSRVQRSYI